MCFCFFITIKGFFFNTSWPNHRRPVCICLFLFKPTFILAYFDIFSNTNFYFFVNGGGTREVIGAFFPRFDLSTFPLLKDKWQKSAILVKVLDFCPSQTHLTPLMSPFVSMLYSSLFWILIIISINFILFSSSIKERQEQGVQRA